MKYECDCGAMYSSLVGVYACSARRHGMEPGSRGWNVRVQVRGCEPSTHSVDVRSRDQAVAVAVQEEIRVHGYGVVGSVDVLDVAEA
jgi:hypothetical protein